MKALVNPSRQARSRATQDRILAATAELLRELPFERISIRRIVREADTSIGSFYARFRDKDALLPVLYAEYETQLEQHLVALRKAISKAETLDDVSRLIVAHFVDILGDIPNLSRALFEYATRAPNSAETGQLGRRRHQQYAFVLDRILTFADEITHGDPHRAADLGLYFVTVAVRNRLLYPKLPSTHLLKISKRELKKELARMLTGYLRG